MIITKMPSKEELLMLLKRKQRRLNILRKVNLPHNLPEADELEWDIIGISEKLMRVS